MNIFKILKPKNPTVVFETDKDIQLINFLKAQNLNELTLGKINQDTFELQNAEIEAIGMRMVERRLNECEKEVYSQDR